MSRNVKFEIRKWISFFLMTVLLVVNACPVVSLAGEEVYLDQMLKMYQENPMDLGDLIANMNAIEEPVELTYGDVRIRLKELIYDGVWMYTAAEIQAVDSEKTIVMPGAADPGDPICGFNNVQIRDERSFWEAANEDEKQLLVVYVYPTEFDGQGEYFLDYFQLQDRTVLFSGCKLNTGNAPVEVSWSVQIYAIDMETMKFVRLFEEETEIQELAAYGEIQTQTYHAKSIPSLALILRKTLLTMYTSFEGETEDIRVGIFTDDQGNLISNGLSVEGGTLQLQEFPEIIYIANEDGAVTEFQKDEAQSVD